MRPIDSTSPGASTELRRLLAGDDFTSARRRGGPRGARAADAVLHKPRLGMEILPLHQSHLLSRHPRHPGRRCRLREHNRTWLIPTVGASCAAGCTAIKRDGGGATLCLANKMPAPHQQDHAWRDYLREQNVTEDDQDRKELFKSHAARLQQVRQGDCSGVQREIRSGLTHPCRL